MHELPYESDLAVRSPPCLLSMQHNFAPHIAPKSKGDVCRVDVYSTLCCLSEKFFHDCASAGRMLALTYISNLLVNEVVCLLNDALPLQCDPRYVQRCGRLHERKLRRPFTTGSKELKVTIVRSCVFLMHHATRFNHAQLNIRFSR